MEIAGLQKFVTATLPRLKLGRYAIPRRGCYVRPGDPVSFADDNVTCGGPRAVRARNLYAHIAGRQARDRPLATPQAGVTPRSW
jgi:hypothetical protein